jgi:hypothetical protein
MIYPHVVGQASIGVQPPLLAAWFLVPFDDVAGPILLVMFSDRLSPFLG